MLTSALARIPDRGSLPPQGGASSHLHHHVGRCLRFASDCLHPQARVHARRLDGGLHHLVSHTPSCYHWQYLIVSSRYPVYSLLLPIYSFWCMDDFSWGNTRLVIGEGNNKKVIMNDDEKFDDSMIPLKKFSGMWWDLLFNLSVPDGVRRVRSGGLGNWFSTLRRDRLQRQQGSFARPLSPSWLACRFPAQLPPLAIGRRLLPRHEPHGQERFAPAARQQHVAVRRPTGYVAIRPPSAAVHALRRRPWLCRRLRLRRAYAYGGAYGVPADGQHVRHDAACDAHGTSQHCHVHGHVWR